MSVTPRLDLKLKQSLLMTPQLQQAIKLLQMSNLELTEYLKAELEKNPLLETEDETLARVELKEKTQETENQDYDEQHTKEIPLDVDEEYADSVNTWEEKKIHSDHENVLEQTISSKVSFKDHVINQINLAFAGNAERIIALNLLDMLDPSGYLVGELSEIEKMLNCSLQRIEQVLQVLKTFEPTGIFSRSLSECLASQLKEKNRLDPAMQILLDHLALLAARDYQRLQEFCGVESDDLQEMIKEIRALNPKPASIFEHSIIQPVIPDLIMRSKTDGSWTVELNSATLPRVLINNDYLIEINLLTSKKEEKHFINEKIASANWLIKSLQQRANTILKTAAEIVIQQQDFFNKGIAFFKPLTLKDVAAAIEMHESTISRVTTNKYIATPRGVFELKYFFSQSLSGTEGQNLSAEAVKFRIKNLIASENPKKILSDDQIVSILNKEGIDIARRTVAKYREAMKIGSSVQRRKTKQCF